MTISQETQDAIIRAYKDARYDEVLRLWDEANNPQPMAQASDTTSTASAVTFVTREELRKMTPEQIDEAWRTGRIRGVPAEDA